MCNRFVRMQLSRMRVETVKPKLSCKFGRTEVSKATQPVMQQCRNAVVSSESDRSLGIDTVE